MMPICWSLRKHLGLICVEKEVVVPAVQCRTLSDVQSQNKLLAQWNRSSNEIK